MSDPLNPGPSLLSKLGSIAVHADELTDMTVDAIRGHEIDKITIKGLISDPEVSEWLTAMRKMAMLPVKR